MPITPLLASPIDLLQVLPWRERQKQSRLLLSNLGVSIFCLVRSPLLHVHGYARTVHSREKAALTCVQTLSPHRNGIAARTPGANSCHSRTNPSCTDRRGQGHVAIMIRFCNIKYFQTLNDIRRFIDPNWLVDFEADADVDGEAGG